MDRIQLSVGSWLGLVGIAATMTVSILGGAAWVIGRIDDRISRMEHRLTAEIGNLDSRLSNRIGNLDSRLSNRMDRLDDRMDGLDERLVGLDKRMDELAINVAHMRGQLDLLTSQPNDINPLSAVLENEPVKAQCLVCHSDPY